MVSSNSGLWLFAALSACRMDYMYDRIVIDDVERWDLAELDGDMRVWVSSEAEDLECYYRWSMVGEQHLELDPCPTCLIIWSVDFEQGTSSADERCPAAGTVWPRNDSYLGIAAALDPGAPSCHTTAHYADPVEVMEDPKAHLDELIFVGVERGESWSASCYYLGPMRLGIDKYSEDLIGNYALDFTTSYWDTVDLSGSIRASNEDLH